MRWPRWKISAFAISLVITGLFVGLRVLGEKMNRTPWIVFDMLIFLGLGLAMAYIGIRQRYKTRMKPRGTLPVVFGATAFVLWAAGCLLQQLGSGVLEDAFKILGTILFVITAPLFDRMRRIPPSR